MTKDDIVTAEVNRLSSIDIVSEDMKTHVLEAAQMMGVAYLPQSKDFIQTYILSDVEYPTIKSKLSQALTELKVRLDNLAQRHNDQKKRNLDIKEKKLQIEEILEQRNKYSEIEIERLQIDIDSLEYQNQQNLFYVNQVYQEMLNWKQTVNELCIKMEKDHPSEVDFSDAKMEEMEAKITVWKRLNKQGLLEMTPSKLQAILSNPNAWNDKN